MKKIALLIIHCTATPEGRSVSSAELWRWHTSPPPAGRGWKQVGYSDMIHLNGSVENLVKYNDDHQVDKWEITNGAAGINAISRHLVYVGGMTADGKRPKDTRNQPQLQSMREYVLQTIAKHPHIRVGGHNQFANKACPSFDVPSWLKSIGVADANIYTK